MKRPDLLLINNEKRKARIVEITVAADQFVPERVTDRYNRLRKKLNSDLQLDFVKLVPIIIITSRRITRECLDNLSRLLGFDKSDMEVS